MKLAALKTLKYMAKNRPDIMEFDNVQHVIPEFKTLLRDRNTAVRSYSELTLAFVLQLDKSELLFDVSSGCCLLFFIIPLSPIFI